MDVRKAGHWAGCSVCLVVAVKVGCLEPSQVAQKVVKMAVNWVSHLAVLRVEWRAGCSVHQKAVLSVDWMAVLKAAWTADWTAVLKAGPMADL
jgi:hypothetical protein